ncbi:MAG: TonB-dependent receptor [Paludibacteraceae bacterium]|nr:TonB-dependent receptor [Paludibacteraceae bacterium]
MNKFGLTNLTILYSASLAYGNQPDSTFSQTEIKEVIVTGKSQELTPATNTSHTIKVKEAERLGVSSVSNAIRRMAGADIKDYGGIGGLKTISVRSLGSKHTAVIYDGVALSDCQNGQIDLGRFSLDQISSLKLTIGADNNLLHSARHFASPSVLEMQSGKPSYDDEKKFHAMAKVTAGSFGLVNPTVSFDHQVGSSPLNSIKASADYLRADGQYPYTLTNGQITTEEKRKNTAIESGHAELNGHFFLTPSRQLSAKAYYFSSDRELPGSVVLYNNISNKERLKDQNFFTQLHYRSDHWKRWVFLVDGKFNWAACRYHDEAKKYPNGEVNDNYFQREWYGSGVAMFKASKSISIANAADYTFNSFNSNIYDCVYPKRHTIQDALSLQFLKQKSTDNRFFSATATALGSYFKNQVEKGDAPQDSKRISPSIVLATKPFLSGFYFRASFKDIFRMPTFNELYFDSFGAKNLNPERTKQYNVGSTYQIESEKRVKSFSISADAYYNEVKDKIVAIPRMFVWSIINMGYVEIKGLDCTMNCEFSTSKRTALFLSAKYAYQHAIDKTDVQSDIYKHQIPYTPLHSGNGSLAFENPYVNISYNVNIVGKRYCQPQNNKANKVDAYSEHGITLYKKLKFKHFDTELRGDILNLTDKQYEVVKYYPMPKRSYKASIEFNF